MPQVIVYDSPEKKNQLEAEYASALQPIDRLKLYLDLMDFYLSLKSKKASSTEEDGIEWIVLKRNEKDKS
jgi:hypothetical protein